MTSRKLQQPKKSYLNITNGDCAVALMQKAGIPGDFLPWQDVLHEGPVPEKTSLEELSEIRSKFIADRGWGTPDEVEKVFKARDTLLKSCEQYEKIILWFEHDLYDQLQILQILDWFHQHRPKESSLSIICVDRYLGTLSVKEMASLFQYEKPITEEHYTLAQKAWSAFRSTTPVKWNELLTTDTATLPFLHGAILRLLEEYPSCNNGLSRTAHQALKVILQGETQPEKIFAQYQESEDRIFMGDTSFWVILHELLDSSPALLGLTEGRSVVLTLPTNPNQKVTITTAGKAVLSGVKNWLDITKIDRWIGGVHLTPDNIWCWDADSNCCRNFH